MFTWKEIIHIAIQIEQNGEEAYRYAAELSKVPHISRALSHLADEEARHTQWLSRLSPSGSIPSEASGFEKITRIFLRETVADQTFSLQKIDLAAITSLEELLTISLEFEKDTLLFYDMIRRFAPDEDTVAIFDMLIAEENNHIDRLKNEFQSMLTAHENNDSLDPAIP